MTIASRATSICMNCCRFNRINAYDGGFYIGKASVASRDPIDPDDFNKQNVGIYRLQAHGPDIISLMTIPSHDMGRQIMAAEQEGKPLKIAVMLGNHPAVALFAGTPVGYEESEYEYGVGDDGRADHFDRVR